MPHNDENNKNDFFYKNQFESLFITDASKNIDKEMYDFLTGNNKPFTINFVRSVLRDFNKEEMSFSRFVEILNETAFHWRKSNLL